MHKSVHFDFVYLLVTLIRTPFAFASMQLSNQTIMWQQCNEYDHADEGQWDLRTGKNLAFDFVFRQSHDPHGAMQGRTSHMLKRCTVSAHHMLWTSKGTWLRSARGWWPTIASVQQKPGEYKRAQQTQRGEQSFLATYADLCSSQLQKPTTTEGTMLHRHGAPWVINVAAQPCSVASLSERLWRQHHKNKIKNK